MIDVINDIITTIIWTKKNAFPFPRQNAAGGD